MAQSFTCASRRISILVVFCLSLIAGACVSDGNKPAGIIDLAKLPTTFKATAKFSNAASRPGMSDPTIYRMGDSLRAEVSFNNILSVTILKFDQKKSYILFPASKAYFELPLDEKLRKQFELIRTFGVWPNAKVEPLGMETFNMHPCVKLKLIAKINDQDASGILWCATDLKNLPIRIEADANGQKNVMELTNVSFDVDPKAFEPPPDFQKKDSSAFSPR